MVIAFMSFMILAPLRRIERRLYPDADHRALGTGSVLPDGDGRPQTRSAIQPSRSADSPSDAVGVSSTAAQHPDEGIRSQPSGPEPDSAKRGGTPALFLEIPAGRCLRPPNSLRVAESCAGDAPEYQEIFGPGGSIQRCKEQFVGSRFSPRKTLHSDRCDLPQFDPARSIHEPTDVCVIALSRASHAA